MIHEIPLGIYLLKHGRRERLRRGREEHHLEHLGNGLQKLAQVRPLPHVDASGCLPLVAQTSACSCCDPPHAWYQPSAPPPLFLRWWQLVLEAQHEVEPLLLSHFPGVSPGED